MVVTVVLGGVVIDKEPLETTDLSVMWVYGLLKHALPRLTVE